MVNIKIFEDQTGFQLFPEKSYNKDTTIVKFFDNKIDLYMTKGESGEDFLIISCYVLVHKGQERPIGCYILGSGIYSDNIFTIFKNSANEALKSIGFKPQYDQDENAIFDGLEKFDYISSKIEIDEILQAILSGEKLSFNAGNILDISAFCRQILKNTKKIKIAISTGKTNFGDINILRNKIYQERLSPTNESKEIFNRRRNSINQKLEYENKKMIEEDKIKKGSIGDSQIVEGIKLIKEGLTTKRMAGYEIDQDIKKIIGEINEKPLPEKSGGIGKNIIVITGILILGIIIGMAILPHIADNIKNYISKVNHEPTPIVNISSPTPIQTTIIVNGNTTTTTTISNGATVIVEKSDNIINKSNYT